MIIRARRNRTPVSLYQTGYIAAPLPEPEKPTNDQRPECANCPYPQHGKTCNGPGGCLFTDMREITARERGNNGADHK